MKAGFPIYPKPGPIGGTLIREVIALMRSRGIDLPITSHILIATSGGSDSMALAHLLVHFGRRVVDRSQISLLHINHGWRGEESDGDEAFVESIGKKWGVRVIAKRLTRPAETSGKSLEEEARTARKELFSEWAKREDANVLTAHHADDLAETVLWRLLTGAVETHGAGITFQHGVEMRPFLSLRKSRIQNYLREVGQSFRVDQTNFSNRFLRARIRSHLMPEVEKIFPRAVEHLANLGLKAQGSITGPSSGSYDSHDKIMAPVAEILMGNAGLKLKRAHFGMVFEKSVANENWHGEIHLPDGWKLIREKKKKEK